MLNVMKRSLSMIVMLLLLSLVTFSGCAKRKIYFYNDSDRIVSGEEKTQPPLMAYPWVCMSKGQYRAITTVNPQ